MKIILLNKNLSLNYGNGKWKNTFVFCPRNQGDANFQFGCKNKSSLQPRCVIDRQRGRHALMDEDFLQRFPEIFTKNLVDKWTNQTKGVN